MMQLGPFRFWLACCALLASPLVSVAQQASSSGAASTGDELKQLRETVHDLTLRVSGLERELAERQHADGGGAASPDPKAAVELADAASGLTARPSIAIAAVALPGNGREAIASEPPRPGTLPGGFTLNYTFDGYYEYNFNHPIGRVNLLRAYDVSSNAFSINQAAIILEKPVDVAAGKRLGARLDLQFGQATETLQGNPANEPRPEIYRNIFQAYGTYVIPAGNGLTVDFGKWSSSLGMEGNYTKDQINYSRSYYFYFLPFYHAGIRANYKLNDKLAVNYWIVNGNNQSEPTNSFKDELFGVVLTPAKSVSWTVNYYLGQDHPDVTQTTQCNVPVQPGLCFTPISPAPDGKLHIFDSYVNWQASSRLTFAAEADYVLEREWANAGPGQSSAPAHVVGGAGYTQYQLTPRVTLAARAEYLSDRGGLFSETTQALKETTATLQYKLADGFDAFFEYRRDWSNRPYFYTNHEKAPSSDQSTAGLGLVWWYGGKQGAW